jgi:26S proteasome regulatory subunit N2
MMLLEFNRHTSAAGVLAQLQDPQKDVQIYALKKLDSIVHYAWHEIADHVSRM